MFRSGEIDFLKNISKYIRSLGFKSNSNPQNKNQKPELIGASRTSSICPEKQKQNPAIWNILRIKTREPERKIKSPILPFAQTQTVKRLSETHLRFQAMSMASDKVSELSMWDSFYFIFIFLFLARVVAEIWMCETGRVLFGRNQTKPVSIAVGDDSPNI